MLAQCSISIPPENIRKAKVFWRFSGGIEIKHWAKMGYLEFKEVRIIHFDSLKPKMPSTQKTLHKSLQQMDTRPYRVTHCKT